VIETDTAQTFVAFDQDDFLAKVSRVKSGGITARPRADNYDFSFDWVHRKWGVGVMEYWSDDELFAGTVGNVAIFEYQMFNPVAGDFLPFEAFD